MKNNKGITLITLTVAVLIMIILSSMLIYNAKNGLKIKNLKDMQNDIEILEDKVNAYYVKYAEVPAEIEYLGNINFEPQPNDDDKYYVLDLKALEGISLNYGSEFTQIKSEEDTYKYNDIYIINKQSMHIYYAKGIEIDGVAYYTNSEDTNVTSLRGNYLIAQKQYANTLKEAVDMAQNGDTIKVLKDVYEEIPVEITKDVVIDTNEKNLTFKETKDPDPEAIIISQNTNVIIMGNGILKSNATDDYFVRNNGNLTVNDIEIYSDAQMSYMVGKGNVINCGVMISNNSKIDKISNIKETYINGGKYDTIFAWPGKIEINSGEINYLDMYQTSSSCVIKGGTINEIWVNIAIGLHKLTIGDIDKPVNQENPRIKLFTSSGGLGLRWTFANGIIESSIWEDEEGLPDDHMTIRTGYQIKETTEGYILQPES